MDLDAQRGGRIQEERKRLGWSQQTAADAAGIRREMWARYEVGSEPGAKALAGMAAAGVDVLYILTGQRSQPVAPTATLPPRVRALVQNYEATDEEGRRHIERAADLEAQSAAAGRKKAARGGQ